MSESEPIAEARVALARAVRVMSKLGYFDPSCHASVRTPDGILITPDFDPVEVPSPRLLTGDRLVVVDSGIGTPPLVREEVLAFHRAIYERRVDVGAILFAFPATAMAHVAAGRPLRRITHAESWMVATVAPVADAVSYLEDPARLTTALSPQHRIVPVAGAGTAFLGPDIDVAISDTHSYEYLARMNLLSSSMPWPVEEVTGDEIRIIQEERATPETVGSVDGRAYLRSFDDPMCSVDEGDSVKSRVALSCRILASHRSLVGFYEHVSHRLVGQEAFAMSPAKNFAQIRPSDILVVGLDDEATWISGSHPPAPFRRFHRDIFLARPDVVAIVHTHEMYGRLFTGAGRDLVVVDRMGVGLPSAPARLGRTSMVFNETDRRDAVEALGPDSIYHTDFHGTDYVAATIEDATVAAVHREAAYRMLHTVLRIGEPVPLTKDTVAALARSLPGPEAWWRFYADLLSDHDHRAISRDDG